MGPVGVPDGRSDRIDRRVRRGTARRRTRDLRRASLVVGVDNYSYALVTAVAGAIAWALTAWIPLFGPLLALLAWAWVVNWRYPGGWVDAGLVGVVAWGSALAILFVLDAVLELGVGAFGLPGV